VWESKEGKERAMEARLGLGRMPRSALEALGNPLMPKEDQAR
jgi:hypothetical protein